MKQSTFSAVMANNLLTLLQGYTKGIRFVAVLTLLLTVGIGQVWGAVVSGTTYSTASSMPEGWTMNGAYNNSSYLKLVSSTNYIQTDEFCVKSFTSIKLKARKFGGPNAAQALITVEWIVDGSSTVLGTIAPASTSLTDYTISSPASITSNKEGCVKISCKGASSSKGSGVSAVTITYTEGSCSDCTPLEMSEVTATAGDRQIQLSWDAVDNASSYTVTCKNKNTGVSAGTVGGVSGSGTKTCTITGLTNGTTYTWSVMPVGDGSTDCAENDPVEGEATPNVYYTVTWMNNGVEYTTTSVAGGNNPTFPDAPSSCDATSTTFYGWATSPWSGKIDDISDKTIYTSANGMPVVNANGTIYYAVFCEGGGGTELLNETFDNDLTSDGIQALSQGDAFLGDFSGETSKTYKGAKGTVKFGTSSAVGYITSKSLDLSTVFTVTLDACKYSSDAGNIEVTVGTQTKTITNSSLGAAGTFNTYTLEFEAATSSSTVKIGTSSKRAYIDNVIIATAGEGSNYITTCCTALGAVNNLFINNADNNVTATWAATSSGGESYYLVKLYNSDKTTVIESQTVASSTKTYTFTDPDAGEYWVSVTPLGEGDYCEKGTETFSTNNVTITGNVTVTFDANGGSLTTTTQLIQYNTATNLTTFANLGGSVPTCKKFKNWNTKSDGSGETYTDGQSVTLTGALKLYAIYEDIKYSVTDGTMTGVKSHSYSSNSITCGATLTITCAAADTHKGNPTVTATGTHGNITVVSATKVTIENIQSDIEVSISYEPKTTYTITWHVSGTSPSTTTNFIEDTPLEFPTPPNAPNDCAEKEFVGWVDESQKDYYHAENAPTFIQEGTPVNANANYYAVFATPDANGVGSDYKKVTSNLSDWSGEYLIVYETSETAGVAFDGSLADLDNTSNDTKPVEIENESIAATEETNAINFTIGKIENSSNYYIKSASGKYIGRTADSNGMNISSSDKYPHQISFSDPGWSIPVGEIIMLQSVINGSTVGTPMLLYMSGTGSRFRYYDSAQDPIALYRKSSYTDYTTTCVETFNVIYEANGATSGNVPIDENNYILDATVTVLGNTGNLQKTHYSFVEWNTQADGNGTPYQAGETFTITEDVTLYAIWEELPKFTVIWSVDGDPTTEQVYQGYQPTSPPAISTPPCGDVFVGWTDAENGNYEHGTSNLYKTLGNMPTISKETTFYAVFADYVSE